MKSSLGSCLICQGDLIEEAKSNNYFYFKCQHCFTSQIIPQPSSALLLDYYNRFHLNDLEGGFYDWVEDRMQADFATKIRIIRKFVNNENILLLDVGCGKGFFVKEAIKNGFDAMGIDISNSGIDYGKRILKVKSELKSIEELAVDSSYNEKFDCITLWATIEHVSNPLSFLNAINKCLKKNGFIFLDTGLGNDFYERFLTGHSQWYDALQHLFVYSEEGLKILLKNSGFEYLYIDKNFERNSLRKVIRYLRHSFLCLSSFLLLRPFLGRTAFKAMKLESKWPIGKLVHIVARKV